jgi:hypothetical protein
MLGAGFLLPGAVLNAVAAAQNFVYAARRPGDAAFGNVGAAQRCACAVIFRGHAPTRGAHVDPRFEHAAKSCVYGVKSCMRGAKSFVRPAQSCVYGVKSCMRGAKSCVPPAQSCVYEAFCYGGEAPRCGNKAQCSAAAASSCVQARADRRNLGTQRRRFHGIGGVAAFG